MNFRSLINLSRRRWKQGGIVALLLLAGLVILLLWPMDTSVYLDQDGSAQMLDRHGRRMAAFLNAEQQWCFPLARDEISPYLEQACVAVEDHRFYHHFGVDPVALLRAVGQNLWHRRVASGASTLTMQVAKHGGHDSRSVWGKLRQLVTAVRLERRVSKDDLLMAYLNGAPYGDNVVGCEAAAQRYWGKPAQELTLSEAALLAALPKAPGLLNPLKHPQRALDRRNYVLRRMEEEGCITEARYREACATSLGVERHDVPFLAPHLAMRLRGPISNLKSQISDPHGHPEYREAMPPTENLKSPISNLKSQIQNGEVQNLKSKIVAATPQPRAAVPHLPESKIKSPKSKIVTTLDFDIQRTAERLAREAVEQPSGEITNAALMVVDVSTATVLARVGSADFFTTPGGGMVDACRAPRSPGSTLKPFVYALAMERNVLYGCEMLQDGSLDYGLYAPQNFDLTFRGLLTSGEALRQSLNVPAFTVFARVGEIPLWQFLTSLGLTTLAHGPEYYGLGMVIGNCEVRLEEMAGAYCMLANLGEYRPLRLTADDPVVPGQPMLSRGTCVKLFEMLERGLPEELSHDVNVTRQVTPRVAWKTGTSTGYRDAWCFVFNRQFVVGAWLGNNDGRSSSRLVGGKVALPLAAKVFRSLTPPNTPAWPEAGDDLHEVVVCAQTGLPASPWCPHTKRVLLPRQQYLHRSCDVHRPAPGASGQAVEYWPGSAKGWDLAKVNAAQSLYATPAPPLGDGERASPPSLASGTSSPPPLAGGTLPPPPLAGGTWSPPPLARGVRGDCSRFEALQILEPADKAEYVLTQESQGDRIRLSTSLDEQAQVYWYMDDRYLGQSTPATPLFLDLQEGRHLLACMTPEGATAAVRFSVTQPQQRLDFTKR